MKTAVKVTLGFFAGVGVATALGVAVAHKDFGGYGGGHGWRMMGWVEHRLDLNTEQSAKLEQLMDTFHDLRSSWREQRDLDVATVRDLLTAPTLNQQEVLALIESKTVKVNEVAPTAVAALAEFTDSLSSEQKQEIEDMMEHRMEHRMGRHWRKHWH